jgi:hypothetical protein
MRFGFSANKIERQSGTRWVSSKCHDAGSRLATVARDIEALASILAPGWSRDRPRRVCGHTALGRLRPDPAGPVSYGAGENAAHCRRRRCSSIVPCHVQVTRQPLALRLESRGRCRRSAPLPFFGLKDSSHGPPAHEGCPPGRDSRGRRLRPGCDEARPRVPDVHAC